MTILSRYILMQFLRMVFLCQSGAITLFLTAEFIERIDDFIEENATLADATLYFLYKIPHLVFLSVPLTVLMASTFTLILFSRENEVLAMRAGGLSLYRIIAPILIASLGISLLTFLANEYIVPFANKRGEYIRRVNIQKTGLRTHAQRNKIWYRSENNTIWQITHYDPSSEKMRGVTLYRMDRQNRLTQRIDADEVVWLPAKKHWEFHKGVIHDFAGEGKIKQQTFKKKIWGLTEKPEDFQKAGRNPETMNYQELGRYIENLRKSGANPTRYVVDMWAKISAPFISFVLAVVGVPFSIRSSRSGGVALGVAIAIGIGAIYLVLFHASLSFGHAGRLPPVLAAWGPNAIFLAGGAYFLASVRG